MQSIVHGESLDDAAKPLDMPTSYTNGASLETQEAQRPSAIEGLVESFASTRKDSLCIAASLTPEDAQLQSMPDASPAKWHLAHTTWFFETFILKPFWPSYSEFNSHFTVLFNSYYNAIGDQYTRADRGLLSRPSLDEIYTYRRYIDEQLSARLSALFEINVSGESLASEKFSAPDKKQLAWLLTLGIQHEKQHQELMLMDIKHAFYQNPMFPIFLPSEEKQDTSSSDLSSDKMTDDSGLTWTEFPSGLRSLGVNSSFPEGHDAATNTFSFDTFSFDNENPEHKRYVEGFCIADRPVTNGEYLEFVEDSGYQRSKFWLADGWSFICENGLRAPLYWRGVDRQWMVFTLHGLRELDPNRPVCHLSYFEATAFASWRGKRLPTEFEWEIAANEASRIAIKNNCASPQFNDFVDLEPREVCNSRLSNMLGGVWEWTSSNYSAYPRFKPFGGNAGEYNGKFMSGQFVLRGGACVSPEKHIRNTYRNFFYPHQRWAFSGLRLADDCVQD